MTKLLLLQAPVLLFYAASIWLMWPFARKPARLAALLEPRNLARPGVRLLDGCVAVVVALGLLVFSLVAARSNEARHSTPPPSAILTGLFVCALLWLLPLATVCCRRGFSLASAFGIRRETARADIRKGLRYGVMMVFPVFIAGLLAALALRILGVEAARQNISHWISGGLHPGWTLVVCALAVTLVPLAEEVCFRGVLLPAFAGKVPRLAPVIGQALLFALLHVNLAAFPGLFLLGLALGIGYARTGSLLTPVAMHAVFNLQAVLATLAFL